MRRRILLAAACIFLTAATANAQSTDSGDVGQRPRAQKRAEMRERMESMMMTKLVEKLELDEQTAQKLSPLLEQQLEAQRQIRWKRIQLMRQLKDEVAKEASDPVLLRKAVNDYKLLELERAELGNRQIDELSQVLSDEQVAKLIVLVPRYERKMKEMIYDSRARRRMRDCAPQASGEQPICPLGNEPMRGPRAGFGPPGEAPAGQ